MKKQRRDEEEEEVDRAEEELRQRIRAHMFPFSKMVVNTKRYNIITPLTAKNMSITRFYLPSTFCRGNI